MNTPREKADRETERPDCACDDFGDSAVEPSTAPSLRYTRTVRIASMDCASEEAEIRRAVAHVPGIESLQFRLAERILIIRGDESGMEPALDAIRQSGFDPVPTEIAGPSAKCGPTSGFGPGRVQNSAPRLAGALLLAITAEAVSYFNPDSLEMRASGMAVATVSIFLAGFDVYVKGLAALRRRNLNINVLMAVAVTGAFAIGQWPEAAMVMALYSIAEAIEARALDRARNAIKGLIEMAPEEASVRQDDGNWVSRPLSAVALGARLRVKPGERVPMDGVITSGQTSINQAPLTGESIPVDKSVGDPVFAGTVNESATFEFEVTAPASNSTLARIIHAVEAAQGTRAPTQTFVDRFAAIYTPAVFLFALGVALTGNALFDWPWHQSVYKALVLLVIACPCALVISTPVTIVSGLAAAARRGILIKGGIYLEEAHKLKAIALDKTGTVTAGKPRLVEWTVLGSSHNRSEIERVTAALAGHSDHPVSRAIASGLGVKGEPVSNFKALHGRGVQADFGGGEFVLGNHRLMEERGQCSAELETILRRHEMQGRTISLLATTDGVVALFAVADSLKPSSREAISSLRVMGITSVMLSGDNQTTADAVAREAGIERVQGDLLPNDKLEAIRALQREFGLIAMAGDGINDAPALAEADIGIAMGAVGTDTALEAADVVVMNDDLERVPELVMLSRVTRKVLFQNISLALGIKAVFLVLAVVGSASMWMAVFADMGASLLVVLNGLRLLRTGRQ